VQGLAASTIAHFTLKKERLRAEKARRSIRSGLDSAAGFSYVITP